MRSRVLLDSTEFKLTIDRLCYQLIEDLDDPSHSALIGIQPRGVFFAERIYKRLTEIDRTISMDFGLLDPTFYRDDFRRRTKPITAKDTKINFSIEDRNVILVDDVFYTGRTIKAAMDALLDFGRPRKVELMVLIDRRFSRQLPIQPDYIGKTIDSVSSERVVVEFKEAEGKDTIWIVPEKKTE